MGSPLKKNVRKNRRKDQVKKSMIVFNLEKKNSGRYFCYGTNFTAKSVLVVIPLEVHLYKVTPTWVDITEGSSVTLACNSIEGIEWFGVHLHKQSKSLNGNTLTLHNLQRKHSGHYFCRNVNYFGTITHTYASIIVDGYTELI